MHLSSLCLQHHVMFWVYVCLHISLSGLPWWLSSKESPCQAGDVGSIPGPGRSHVLRNNEAHMPQLLNLCSRGLELQLLKPAPPTACALKQEKPLQWEAGAPQPLRLEKKPTARRPCTARNNTQNYNLKYFPLIRRATVIRLGPTQVCHDHILTWLHLQNPVFK